MYKHKLLLIMLICLVGLTGCAEPKVIDDIRLVQALGFDYYNEKNILGTLATPIYAHTGGSGQVEAKTDSFSVIGHRGRALDTLLESRSEHPLQLGKLMVILYGKEVSQEGIYQFIDILNRNPDVGRTISLAVVDGKAEDVLNGHYQSDPLVSIYLSDLIHHNTRLNFPKSNLHEFLYSYYGEGMDPFLPLLKKKQQHVEIEGIALFDNDRYVDYIPFNKAFPFKMLFESFRGGSFSVPMDKNHFMSIMNIDSSVHYKVSFNRAGEPIVTIQVKEKGFLRATSAKISPKDNLDLIQRQMKKTLEKEGNAIIKKIQKLNVDPLRIGDRVRTYDRNWTKEKWVDIYPHITIHLNVDVNLAQTGIIE